MTTIAVAGISGGLSFVVADGLDRLLATYNPAATGERPKDKFTSDGDGTLANALNVGARPGLARIGVGIGVVAVPAFGAMYTKGHAKTALTASAFGAGISTFKMLWNGLVMPLLRPKDPSPAELQTSLIARLYPAEVAAAINMAKKNQDGSERAPQMTVSSGGAAGALSGPGDVGPFAGVAGDSQYPDAAQALRRAAGLQGPGGDYPTVQNTWGTGEYPTAQQALVQKTGQVGGGDPGQPGVSDWSPGPPSNPGPGPQAEPGKDPACGCIGDQYNTYLGFVEGAPSEE